MLAEAEARACAVGAERSKTMRVSTRETVSEVAHDERGERRGRGRRRGHVLSKRGGARVRGDSEAMRMSMRETVSEVAHDERGERRGRGRRRGRMLSKRGGARRRVRR